LISLVLSGGKGERLWPVSREKLPKPFAPFFDKCLFTQTVERLNPFGDVWVCTAQGLKDLTEKQIRTDQLKIQKSVYEPVGRNTAPAIALVVRALQMQGRSSEILAVFPSDHWIEDVQTFQKVINLAQDLAQGGRVVTLGISPTYPATGFGYIELKDQKLTTDPGLSAYPVAGFTEKPHLEKAEQYLKSGNYVWNSGIFIFKVEQMIENFQTHMPQLWDELSRLKEDLSNLSHIYQRLKPQSIDYGIMEKINNLVNIPCQMGWSDLGSWDDLAEIESRHPLNSLARRGDVSSTNNFVYSLVDKNVHLLGVRDLMVVETPDALFITKKGHSPDIRQLTDLIKVQKNQLMVDHTFESRPWGNYQNIYEEPSQFKTKIISVDRGQQLSYQSHQKRSEIWVTVIGKGEVVLDDQIIPVRPGSVVTVPAGSKHRMRNTSSTQILKFVEVQLGESFAESDITRYEDDYQRT